MSRTDSCNNVIYMQCFRAFVLPPSLGCLFLFLGMRREPSAFPLASLCLLFPLFPLISVHARKFPLTRFGLLHSLRLGQVGGASLSVSVIGLLL